MSMENLMVDCDVTSDDFRRTFSFESCSDLLFDDRFEFTTHQTSSSATLSECVAPTIASSQQIGGLCQLDVSQPPDAPDASSQIDIFGYCGDVIDDSSFLATEIDFDSQPASFGVCTSSNKYATSQRPTSLFDSVGTKACEASYSVQSEPVKKSSEVCAHLKRTSHANYFSFLQSVMIYCKSVSLEDYLEVNMTLINSSVFQHNNYWVRIAPEIVDYLYYTIDYLSGNCPNNFYHRSFRSPILFEENTAFHFSPEHQNSTGQLIWGGRSTDDEMLLTWTDVWWSCRFMSYIPRIWRAVLCDKIPQCHKLTHQEVRKRPRKQNKTEKYQKARKLKANKSKLADFRAKTVTFDSSDSGLGFDAVEYSVIDSEILDSGTVSSISFPSMPNKRFTDFAPLNLNPMLPCNDILPDTLSLISPNGLEESLEALTSAFVENKDQELPLKLPAVVDEHSSFHRQEQNRFSDPKKAFTYLLPNMSLSPVGPTFGATVELSNHISEYPTLEKNLLNHCAKNIKNVYIIDLVRDATARLLGGKGSRVEVVNLFKQSQFVNLSFITQNENLVNGVVGICLEILQNCQTPHVELFVDFTGKSAWRYIPFNIPVAHSTSKSHSISSSQSKSSKGKSSVHAKSHHYLNFVECNKTHARSNSCHVKSLNTAQPMYPTRGRPRKATQQARKASNEANAAANLHANNSKQALSLLPQISTSGKPSSCASLLQTTTPQGLLTVKPSSNKSVQHVTISGANLRCVPAKPTFPLLKTQQQSTSGSIVPQVFYINSVS